MSDSNLDKKALRISLQFVGREDEVNECLTFAGKTLRKEEIEYESMPEVFGPVVWRTKDSEELDHARRRLGIRPFTDAVGAVTDKLRIRRPVNVVGVVSGTMFGLVITALCVLAVHNWPVRIFLAMLGGLSTYELALSQLVRFRAKGRLLDALESCRDQAARFDRASLDDEMQTFLSLLVNYMASHKVLRAEWKGRLVEVDRRSWIRTMNMLIDGVEDAPLVHFFEYGMARAKCRRLGDYYLWVKL